MKGTNHQTLQGYGGCQEHKYNHYTVLHHLELEYNMEEYQEGMFGIHH